MTAPNLSERALEAAALIADLNQRYDLAPHTPWEPSELRHEAAILTGEEVPA